MKFRSRPTVDLNHPVREELPTRSSQQTRPDRVAHGTDEQPCWCEECTNSGQYLYDYHKNKGLWGSGGL